jgi:hypothetical protein
MTALDNGFGMRCPRCGPSNRIDVAATMFVRLYQDGTVSQKRLPGPGPGFGKFFTCFSSSSSGS